MSEARTVAQNVANLYAAPDSDAEMVSQSLLGDRVTVLAEASGERGGFRRVSTPDRYEGWIAEGLLVPYQDQSDAPAATIQTLLADVYSAPDARAEIVTKLTAGARVSPRRRPLPGPADGDWVGLTLPDGAHGYVRRLSLSEAAPASRLAEAASTASGISRPALVAALGRQSAETAKRLVGTPYLWGGCTPFGIDCSGLTQLVYKLNGVQLLRDAHLQFADRRFVRAEAGLGLEVALLEDGDLVAFSRREDKCPTHIGVALGDGRFLHARGGRGVRIDFCDAPEYAETYVGAVRLSADADFSVQGA